MKPHNVIDLGHVIPRALYNTKQRFLYQIIEIKHWVTCSIGSYERETIMIMMNVYNNKQQLNPRTNMWPQICSIQ